MKSGLEDRNNCCGLDEDGAGHGVSMKSGLEDRNNCGRFSATSAGAASSQ